MNGAWIVDINHCGVFCVNTWPPSYHYAVGCLRSGYHNQNDREVGVTNITVVGAGWNTDLVDYNGLFENDDETVGGQSLRVGCRTDYHNCSDNYIWNGFGGDWGWSPSGAFCTNDYHTQYTKVHLGCRDLRTGCHWVIHSTPSYKSYFIGPYWADPIDEAGTFEACDYIGLAYNDSWGCHVALRTEGIIIGR